MISVGFKFVPVGITCTGRTTIHFH